MVEKDESKEKPAIPEPKKRRSSGLMTVKEVAEFFGKSTSTIYEWKDKGYLPFVDMFGGVMFREKDMYEVIQSRWNPATNEFHFRPRGPGRLRPKPTATHVKPKRQRRPLEKGIKPRRFQPRPSVRRRLLAIWKRGQKR